MISGRPGTGKSSMGILIAKELNGSLCKTYDPTNPGDYLENVYNQVNPTDKNPLILLIDEFDILLHSLHNKLVVLHDDIPTEVSTKTKWNNLFDDLNLKLFPNLIVILTTNLTRKTIEKNYEKSYIRPGRVNFHYNISENGENEISSCFAWLKKTKMFKK
jgi:Holliday junction resolvasome RuvABC ATP-dependent DNA helicase subunit